MATVIVHVPAYDFVSRLGGMREWLNGRGCQPSRFTYDPSGENAFAVRLDFVQREDAEEFGKHFNGASD
ncbi:MAG: hypothetical protein JO266_21370 [Acidobacteria bacterium]|nr:hypothetical protein [Acidobacteriota bacterium]